MNTQGNGAPTMTSSTNFSGNALGDCLRAAEADANRFHGAHAQQPWQGPRVTKGTMLAASFALMAMAAAMLLALGPAHEAAPPATVAAAQPAPDNWFTRAPSDVTPDAVADVAPATPAVPATPVNAKPPALAAAAFQPTRDGGDVDTAAVAPASVLSEPAPGTAPRIAPMNVPTVPDEHDRTPGEPDTLPEVRPAG